MVGKVHRYYHDNNFLIGSSKIRDFDGFKKRFTWRFSPTTNDRDKCYFYKGNPIIESNSLHIEVIRMDDSILKRFLEILERRLNELINFGYREDQYEIVLRKIYQKYERSFQIRDEIEKIKRQRTSYEVDGLIGKITGKKVLTVVATRTIELLSNEKSSIDSYILSTDLKAIRRNQGEVKYCANLIAKITTELNQRVREEKRKEKDRIKNIIDAEREEKRLLQEKERVAKETAKAEKKRQELERLRSIARDKESAKRKELQRLKSKLEDKGYCAYCFQNFKSPSDRHADHIHPLSEGGNEVVRNLVLVCSHCNIKKSNMTLREFIIKYKLDRERIENELDSQKKKF